MNPGADVSQLNLAGLLESALFFCETMPTVKSLFGSFWVYFLVCHYFLLKNQVYDTPVLSSQVNLDHRRCAKNLTVCHKSIILYTFSMFNAVLLLILVYRLTSTGFTKGLYVKQRNNLFWKTVILYLLCILH